MLTVPRRGAPPLLAIVCTTVALPAPDAPCFTVTNASVVVVLHAHVAIAVTWMDTSPPPSGAVALAGLTAGVHGSPCCTVKVWPPTVRLPCRGGPVFAAMASFTEPLPLPLLAPTIVMNAAELVSVHEQPDAVLIESVNSSPEAATRPAGAPLTVKAHPPGPEEEPGAAGELLLQATTVAAMRQVTVAKCLAGRGITMSEGL